MKLLNKINYLLPKSKKRQLLILGGLLLIGMVLEMLGLGVLIPAIGVMLSDNIAVEYPILKPLINSLGNPTQTQLIIAGMCVLILVYVVKALFLVYLNWRQSKFSALLSAQLSEDLFYGYLQKPYAFHLQNNSAQLIRNITSEVNFFSSITHSVIALTIEVSIILSLTVVLFAIEPVGAIVVTFFFAVSAYLFQLLTRAKIVKWGELRQIHDGKVNQHLLQGLGGVKDVKLMGREDYFLEKFNESNLWKAKLSTRQFTLQQVPRLYLELLAVIGLVGLIVVMVLQHKPINALIATLGIFVAAAFRMIPSINRIMIAFQSIRFAQPVVEVLYNEFKSIHEDVELAKVITPNVLPFSNDIYSNNLVFNYYGSKANALNGITFTIRIGESIGLVGPSGSGKSTFVDLLLGLLRPAKGNIFVDGVDIHGDIRTWQDQIGYVPQSIYLMDDTLRKNIAFGVPDKMINEDAVLRAIKSAQLDDYVQNLPEGLETFVGERGIRLSGGQRQRIGIARALYRDPAILVLDEATSSLDTDTENKLMEAVDALKGNKTLIIIAHRLSTVQNCDRIFKFERGRIVKEGTPENILT